MCPKLLLQSLDGVYLLIPKLGCNSSGLSTCQNVVVLVGACRWLRAASTRPFCCARVLLASNLHPGCTARACSFVHQRLLWCIGGSNSPWRELVLRHGGCLLTKKAASNTGRVQNGRRSQTCCHYSMQTQVFQIALFKGFLNISHIPPPTGHSRGTNEATRAAELHKVGTILNEAKMCVCVCVCTGGHWVLS